MIRINNYGIGSGVVNYTVSPCSGGGSRNGTITVASQIYQITQNCTEQCNSSQTFQWAAQATISNPNYSNTANDVAIDASGNLYMTGSVQLNTDFGNGIILTAPGTAPDVFVSKHNSSGIIQWAVNYGDAY